MSDGPITGEQAEAARKLLGWSRLRLVGVVGVSERVIANFEQKGFLASVIKINRLRKIFEDAGIEFPQGAPPRYRVRAATGNPPPSSR
jgi:transcriptional regulator with XRE-family HTH domain